VNDLERRKLVSARSEAVIRIERERVFPVPVEQGFSIITDIGRWPSYWPGLVRVDPASRWTTPGDQARLIIRLLGREVELAMTLRELVPNRLVAYDSVQAGLPRAHHERHFRSADRGFAYRIVVEYEPRSGLRGVLDWTVVRRGVNRAVRETMDNLERVLAPQLAR
jgi:Polyketide cyclase / dehydrase and lipid transport